MMLRIDKVIGSNTADPRPSPDRPLHACLATAILPTTATATSDGGDDDAAGNGNNITNSGEIATVGRKNCMIIIDDKCVSRKHAVIALISNRPVNDETVTINAAVASTTTAAATGGRSSLLDGQVMMEYGKPTTPEEIYACESSPSGVICVVKDMGSKFGTYVSVDEILLRKYTPGNNNNDKSNSRDEEEDDETGDDATDDEGVDTKTIDYVELSERQIRAVRLLHSQRDDSSPLPKFRKLPEKQSMPLLQLSHSDPTSNSSHVTILFGPQGSGIRLSLVPFLFTFSRIKLHDPNQDPLLSSLYYIGASHLLQWDVKRSTHLIAQEKIAGAKVRERLSDHLFAMKCDCCLNICLDYIHRGDRVSWHGHVVDRL